MWAAPTVRPAAPLASFKAGKMTAIPSNEGKFRVEADPRRGTLLLEKGSEGTVHFVWKDRATLQVDGDLLMSPEDQKLVKVDTGRPNDRIYLLTFESTNNHGHFFWMQEPDSAKDEDRVKEFNRLMNERPSARPGFGSAGGMAPPGLSNPAAPAVSLDELADILSDLGYGGGEEAMPELGAAPSQAAPPAEGSTAAERTEMDVEPSTKEEEGEGEGTAPKSGDAPPKTEVSDQVMMTEDDLIRALEGPQLTPNLARVVTSDVLLEMIEESDEDTRQVLLALLPEGKQTMEELRLTLHSPQLRQTLVQLSRALNSDNISMVMTNFGLDFRASMHLLQIGDGIGAFLAALEDEAEREEIGRKPA